ncbi:MFS transporter [Streptomyces sp. NPDC055134]
MTHIADKALPTKDLNGRMLMAAVVSAVSGLLYGYDTGIISGGLLQISKEFHIGNDMKQVIAAAILLGAVIGALACSLLSARIGRHRTILLICVVFMLGSVSSSLAPTRASGGRSRNRSPSGRRVPSRMTTGCCPGSTRSARCRSGPCRAV